PMDPAPALEVLHQALDDDETHLVVGDFDWPRFSAVYAFDRARPLLRALPDAHGTGTDRSARPGRRAGGAPPPGAPAPPPRGARAAPPPAPPPAPPRPVRRGGPGGRGTTPPGSS
ncbi:hypothetical protein AB8O53_33805, partial [Streptomyces pilosus]